VLLPAVQADHYEYRWDAAGQLTALRLTNIDPGSG
jgi:YD repeat-containing protein